MRQPPVFDFVPDTGDKLDENDPRSVRRTSNNDAESPAFEPTRDGWRAYEAWCKQIREEWDTDG